MPNTFMGLSLAEDEAEDEVPIMDATAEASAVRRSQREKKACVAVDRRNEWQRGAEERKGKESKEKEPFHFPTQTMSKPFSNLLDNLRDAVTEFDQPYMSVNRRGGSFAPINRPTAVKRPHTRRHFSLIRLPLDASEDLRAEAISILWRAVNQEPNLETAFQYYISFMTVMFPELSVSIELALNNLNYMVVHQDFPDTVAYEEYNDDETIPLYLEQAMVYAGCSLLVPFKNINNQNYTGYFQRRIAAISSMVGGNYTQMGMPFCPEKCGYFKSKMNQFHGVRKRLVQFLISDEARAEELFSIVVRYVLLMIAWAEMTGFVFVMEALVTSVSPVLMCMDVANETKKYFDIADAVFSVSHPALFKFLAPDNSDVVVDKSQFPTLYAVSYSVLSEQHDSVKQLVGPTNINSTKVRNLVAIHKEYLRTAIMMTKQMDRWVPDSIDPDVKWLKVQMRENELSARDIIQLKTFASQGYNSRSFSGVQDSHTA